MLKEENYNLDKLIKVSLHDDSILCGYYEFRKERKLFGFITQKEGLYCSITGIFNCELKDYKNENTIIIDNLPHFKSHVILHYVSDYKKCYYFDTFNEASIFFDKISNKIPNKLII